jgi:transcriptional regulator with XRE-family HTH domain
MGETMGKKAKNSPRPRPGIQLGLKAARVLDNASGRLLAKECYVSESHMSRVKRGFVYPSMGLLVRMGAALGLSTTNVLEGLTLIRKRRMRK